MASEQQIAANRTNAQKCTGPVTAEGKAKSSQNAVKTGLHAKSNVIATENREDYETLTAEYYDRFDPTTPEERCLVDALISSDWLGRRYMAASTAILDYDFTAYKTQDLGLAFIRRSEALGRAQRCITANQRNFAHTLKQLQTIQANRTHDPAPARNVNKAQNEPLKPQLVSFFQDFPDAQTPHQPAPQTSPEIPWEHENLPLAA